MLALELSVILGLVLLNAVLAGAELAIVAIRPLRLDQLAAEGHRGAQSVLALRREPERFFATVQVGISVVAATTGAFGGARFAEDFEPYLAPWLGGQAETVAVALVVGLVSYLSIVLGELVPKSLALKYSEGYALSIGTPLLWLSYLARPFVWVLTVSSNLVLRPFGDATSFGEAKYSADELRDLLGEASRAGTVEPGVSEIAARAIALQGLRARDVMVPRSAVHAVPLGATPDELRAILLESGHSRLPVYREGIDDIVGYLMVKDVLATVWEGALITLSDIVRPAFFAPASLPVRELLRELQERRVQLAMVVDEHGGMCGIVTVEDIVEELVGELVDEGEVEEVPIELRDGRAIVRGHVPLREVNRALALELPESESYTTIAGLCLHLAGTVPAVGTTLRVPGVAQLDVVDASPRRIHGVVVRPEPPRGSVAPPRPAT